MTAIHGETLRQWRRSRGWDVPEMTHRLRRAAGDDPVPDHSILAKQVRRWERDGLTRRAERYELLYARVFGVTPDRLRDGPGDDDVGITATFADPAVAQTTPGLGIRELKHVALALEDARRYLDSDMAGYFSGRLADLAAGDGDRGPRETLPPVLGIIAAIDHAAREVRPTVRRELLATGASAAEFAGFLYRDIRVPESSRYWRDRATEWAMESGNVALAGYILLRKSQDAWDERDGARMLTLAQAAQAPAWQIPPKVRAEAAQQEARGIAMTGGDRGLMRAKLDEAEQLINEPAGETGLGAGYSRQLLAMQTALCYTAAGRPGLAAQVYAQELDKTRFSYRDYGYFRALQAGTLAEAAEPAAAASSAMEALAIARETSSTRTLSELTRTAEALQPWKSTASVRDFRGSLAAL